MKLIIQLTPVIIPLLFLATIPWAIERQAIRKNFQEREIELLRTGMLLTAIALTVSFVLSMFLRLFLSYLFIT